MKNMKPVNEKDSPGPATGINRAGTLGIKR